MYVKHLIYKRRSVAVSLLYSFLTSLVCKLPWRRDFCLFWSLLYHQNPQQSLAKNRCSINEWMILYELAQHRTHSRWFNIMLNLLNWIVILIRAIIVPSGNSIFINNCLRRPHGGYDYVHNCQSAANPMCPGSYPVPFCELFSRKTHWVVLRDTEMAAAVPHCWLCQFGGTWTSPNSKHTFFFMFPALSGSLLPSLCSPLRWCFEVPWFSLNNRLALSW